MAIPCPIPTGPGDILLSGARRFSIQLSTRHRPGNFWNLRYAATREIAVHRTHGPRTRVFM